MPNGHYSQAAVHNNIVYVSGQPPVELENGKIEEITEYCLRDVDTTWKLFEIWKKYLSWG